MELSYSNVSAYYYSISLHLYLQITNDLPVKIQIQNIFGDSIQS